tara:strand:- start:136 stop:531 length:396 start_codon:yes stop_codon:yes gene_type:complete
MLFKFLTGKEISNLQTGLIFSQAAGLIWVFFGLMFLFPSDTLTVNDGGPPVPLLLLIGVLRIVLPIIVGRGVKIFFWVLVVLSILAFVNGFLAPMNNDIQFIWFLPLSVLVEIAVLYNLLSPKGRQELKNP